MSQNPDTLCVHPDFTANVKVCRITDSDVWYADVTLHCSSCGAVMQFICPSKGLSPDEPMTNVDGTELRAPFKPYNESLERERVLDDLFGFGVRPPGSAVS